MSKYKRNYVSQIKLYATEQLSISVMEEAFKLYDVPIFSPPCFHMQAKDKDDGSIVFKKYKMPFLLPYIYIYIYIYYPIYYQMCAHTYQYKKNMYEIGIENNVSFKT